MNHSLCNNAYGNTICMGFHLVNSQSYISTNFHFYNNTGGVSIYLESSTQQILKNLNYIKNNLLNGLIGYFLSNHEVYNLISIENSPGISFGFSGSLTFYNCFFDKSSDYYIHNSRSTYKSSTIITGQFNLNNFNYYLINLPLCYYSFTLKYKFLKYYNFIILNFFF